MRILTVEAIKKNKSWTDVFREARPMEFYAYNTGRITGKLKTYSDPKSIPQGIDKNRVMEWDMMAFGFHHHEKGDILIDCGFGKSFTDHPPHGNLSLVLKIFQKLNGIRYSQLPGEDFENHIHRLKLNPKHVFLTHVHPDHTSGLPSLSSDCIVYYGKKEDTFYYRFIVGGHFKGKKVQLLDFEKDGSAMDPFEKVLDVFGDESLFAISTPGHTRDHISYLINAKPKPRFVVGDAELNRWAVERGIKVNSDYGEVGRRDVYGSSERIRRFLEKYPEVEVSYSHDGQDY